MYRDIYSGINVFATIIPALIDFAFMPQSKKQPETPMNSRFILALLINATIKNPIWHLLLRLYKGVLMPQCRDSKKTTAKS